jgi:hypothetical protein
MALRWEQVVIDSAEPARLGKWWAAALGWSVVHDDSQEFEIQERPGQTPGMLFVKVPEEKAGKNRLHFDFRPYDQAEEVERFLTLGATPVDVGQGTVPWIVLAGPEGNEFCVLSGRPPAA